MRTDPFAFLRGATAIMASDLARTPATGIRLQTCGDAHLANFGSYATPEEVSVFDINDFDETLPALPAAMSGCLVCDFPHAVDPEQIVKVDKAA